jgi:hypothetical protein
MPTEIQDLDPTDANNTGRWPEGMVGGDINDAGRAMEGYLARWFRDTNGSIAATGSSNAFAVTSNRTISSLANNTVMAFTANFSITGAATLNLNGLGAKSIKRFNGNALASGDIVSGQPVTVVYKSSPDVWYMMSALAALTGNTFADFSENAAPGDPAADTGRLYAKDVSGTTRLAYRDSAGTERVLDRAGEVIAIIEDQKAQNTAAQTLTGATDNVRELTTLAYNRDSIASLSSNRFTLPAGTWEIAWWAPTNTANTIGKHQSFLYNQSDSTEVARGTVGGIDLGDTDTDGDMPFSQGSAVVTIAGSKAFEIRHRPESTVGGGYVGNLGTEVYTRVTVRRA